jgi:MFS family permease
MIFDRHHFHLFGSREIYSLYLTIALIHFGEGLLSIFIPIYMWGLGFSFSKIIFFYFLRSFYFVALMLILIPFMKRLSDKMMMFSSIPFLILFFFGLGFLEGNIILFYILPAVAAVGLVLFNTGYQLDFSASADDKYIGREVGTRYMFGSLIKFSAPFIGGVLIAFFGFQNTFFVGGAILFIAVVPLFFFPRRKLSPHLNRKGILEFIKSKNLRPFNISGVGYATESMVGWIIWPLFMFLIIGSIEKFGGIVSIALLASALTTFFVGFLSDAGKRRKVLTWTSSIFALIWATRPLMVNTPLIVASRVGGGIINSAQMVAWSSQYYKLGRAAQHLSHFILSRELLYNLARIVFLPILMLLAYLLPLNTFFTVSFLIAAVMTMVFILANKTHLKDLGGLAK